MEFVVTAARLTDFPRDGAPEVVFAGRSNVGKSSLINSLVGRTVARTSGTPGKTRLANFYRVCPSRRPPFYFVDLPGYGYADSREARGQFDRVASMYFYAAEAGERAVRGQIAGVILVTDARHPGLENDLAALEWLSGLALPLLVVATKADKLTAAGRARSLAGAEQAFGGPVLAVSAARGENLEKLWSLIVSCVNPKPL